MFGGLKKMPATTDLLGRGNGLKKGHASAVEAQPKGIQSKVKRVGVPAQSKRAAFGDITNAKTDKTVTLDGKKKIATAVSKATASKKPVATKAAPAKAIPVAKKKVEVTKKENVPRASKATATTRVKEQPCALEALKGNRVEILKERNLAAGVPLDREEEDFSFVAEGDDEKKELLSVDVENYYDVFKVGIYAQDIFDYYKRRELMFKIPDYISKKNNRITSSMRALLVDWMVEIQENFELNHETLYLGVKLTDTYLSRVQVKIDVLQLVGAAAIFIASKYDERCPPLIEDFTYISGNAFDANDIIDMEMKMLKTVEFDLGVPISYRFLRRYAKVANNSMETLTLARYILELSLMEYDLVAKRDSLIAAASLFIAQQMKKEGKWEGDLIKTSGYRLEDFKDVVIALNKMLRTPPVAKLATVRSKYSHKMFHEVAKIKAISNEELFS